MSKQIELSLFRCLSVIAFVMVSSAGATWWQRQDRIEGLNNTIAGLQLAEDEDLCGLLESLRTASDQLASDLVLTNKIPALKEQVANLTKQHVELESRSVQYQTELEDTRKSLADMENQLREYRLEEGSFTLEKGHTEKFKEIYIGLVDISYNDRVTVTLDGEEMVRPTGVIARIHRNDETIVVIVEDVDYARARVVFRWEVKKKAAGDR